MDPRHRTKISKYLSKHLRHQPERLGLTLGPGGWVDVDALLAACTAHNFPLNRAELDEVVALSDKQRYSFDPSGRRIRANQGHSTDVDLQLLPTPPPDVLYHGTSADALESILATGLDKRARHHVHLSTDVVTATNVGRRHGRPVVLAIDAKSMAAAGVEFYCSDNGIWLVDAVPPAFLRVV